jgi:hypothetical protein
LRPLFSRTPLTPEDATYNAFDQVLHTGQTIPLGDRFEMVCLVPPLEDKYPDQNGDTASEV